MISVMDAVKRLTGTYGYVAVFDLTNYLPQSIAHIQGMSVAGVLSDVIISQVDSSALDGYCEDVDCPDIAFSVKGNKVDVFLKTTAYPYQGGVKVEFTFYRNAQTITDVTTEHLDIPASAKELFKNRCLNTLYVSKNMRVPFAIQNNIRREKAKLGL